jgi:hypothetical protein
MCLARRHRYGCAITELQCGRLLDHDLETATYDSRKSGWSTFSCVTMLSAVTKLRASESLMMRV